MGLLDLLPKVNENLKGWPWTKETDHTIYSIFKQWPKISIITPSYNHGHFLEETIRSILLQNYPNLEFIIMDGKSTDGSVDIIKKYDSWITHWKSEVDRGQSHAINKGIEITTGEIVNWVNSDDSLTSNALFEITKFFVENSSIDLISGNCNLIYPGLKKTFYRSVKFEPLDFISRISIHQPVTFWRTKLFQEIGILDESLHYCMDYDLWARIVFNHQTDIIDKTLANFRRYPESKSSNLKDQSKIYLDYRTVVSRVFTTIAKEHISKLKQLKIFHNEDGVNYPINADVLSDMVKAQMVNKYIMTCATQEYNMGNKKRANQLLKSCVNKAHFREAFVYLIKNNFGYRKFFDPFRKSSY
jgi:glycosyltransferase involved in cell wall biosynthesis